MTAAACLNLVIVFAALNGSAAVAFYCWMVLWAEPRHRLSTVLPQAPSSRPSQRPPSAVVLLCVRGHDPFLSETLAALARQVDCNYRIIVVVDHPSDPAWKTVQLCKQTLGLNDTQLELQSLQDRSVYCGLKCSALIQAVNSLKPEEQNSDTIIVTADSDAVPHETWLRRLLEALRDPKIGASTSNQWFDPSGQHIGSWVRSVWQAGAIVPTAMLANPWAGSFAIRYTDLTESGLLEQWSRSIVDDGPVRKCLQSIGKSLVFVPQNIVINREDCPLGFCFRYIARMLTWSRLFESTFWITAVHAGVTCGVQAIVFGWLAWTATWNLAWVLGLGPGDASYRLALVAYLVWHIGQLGGYLVVQAAVNRATRETARPTARRAWLRSLNALLYIAAAIPITTLAYGYGCWFALTTHRIVWRRVHYEIQPGKKVRLVNYQPFQSDSHQTLERHSL